MIAKITEAQLRELRNVWLHGGANNLKIQQALYDKGLIYRKDGIYVITVEGREVLTAKGMY